MPTSPLLMYFMHQARAHIIIIIMIIGVPVAMPFVFDYFLSFFVNNVSSLSLTPYELPLLPQPEKVAYYDANTVYFSYAPDTIQNMKFVN